MSEQIGITRQSALRIAAGVGTVVGLISAGLALTLAIFSPAGELYVGPRPAIHASPGHIESDRALSMEASRRLASVEQQLVELTGRKGNVSNSRRLAARLVQAETRQARLEEAITQDPLRAVQLPLLQRDLQHLREQVEIDRSVVRDTVQSEVRAMQGSVDRMYSLSQWLLGGIFFGMLGLALNSFFGSKG